LVVDLEVNITSVVEEPWGTCANHLRPMHEVFGRGATNVVVCHHWDSGEIDMGVLSETSKKSSYSP